MSTHREALADLLLSGGRGHGRTHSVVHIAGHVAAVMTELYQQMGPRAPSLHTPAVVQFTERERGRWNEGVRKR